MLRLLDGQAFPGGPVTYLVEAPEVNASRLEPWPALISEDPLRASYARSGGLTELTQWLDESLAERSQRRTSPIEQVRTWNLSCLLTASSTLGPLWIKAVPPFFAHEGAVITTLATVDSTLVPAVVAARPGAIVMEEAGDRDGYGIESERLMAGVDRFESARQRIDLDALADVPRLGAADFAERLIDVMARHEAALSVDERVLPGPTDR